MRAQRVVVTLAILVVALATARVGLAQTSAAANVSSVVRGGVVVVSYDLTSVDPAATFAVTLEVSGDGGQTYAVRPRTVTGDVGPAVRAGVGKQITWEAAREVETLEFDRYRYRVKADPVRGQGFPVTAQPPRTAGTRPATPAAKPPAATPSKSKVRCGRHALMGQRHDDGAGVQATFYDVLGQRSENAVVDYWCDGGGDAARAEQQDEGRREPKLADAPPRAAVLGVPCKIERSAAL